MAPDQALDAGLQWGRPHQVWQRSYYIISQLKTGHLKSGFREKLICSQAFSTFGHLNKYNWSLLLFVFDKNMTWGERHTTFVFDLLLERDTEIIRKAHTVWTPPNVPPSLAGFLSPFHFFVSILKEWGLRGHSRLQIRVCLRQDHSAAAVHHTAEIMTMERVHKGGKYQSN